MLLNHAYPDIFSEPEAQLLASLLGPPITARSRSRVIRANVVLNQSLYLTRGMLGRYSLDRQGRRQFVGIQIVGDYFDIAAYLLKGTAVLTWKAACPHHVRHVRRPQGP